MEENQISNTPPPNTHTFIECDGKLIKKNPASARRLARARARAQPVRNARPLMSHTDAQTPRGGGSTRRTCLRSKREAGSSRTLRSVDLFLPRSRGRGDGSADLWSGGGCDTAAGSSRGFRVLPVRKNPVLWICLLRPGDHQCAQLLFSIQLSFHIYSFTPFLEGDDAEEC